MATSTKRLTLFGGTRPWKSSEWTSQDDRVRGGSSVSYLIPASDGTTVILNGNLNTTTLGGAGFASQRTTERKVWDLSSYDGIEVIVKRSSDENTNKMFTLVLKNEIPPSNPDGSEREEPTLSYETTFKPLMKSTKPEKIFLPFSGFKATYRGREKTDAPPLDLFGILRFSLMIRSFFNEQSGPFQVVLVSISAVTAPTGKAKETLRRQDPEGFYDEYDEFDNDHDDHDMSADGGKQEMTVARGGWGCNIS